MGYSMDQILELSKKIHDILDSKKAQDLTVLSVKGISTIADYFIIATGTSSTHINALADHIEKELSKDSIFMKHREGQPQGGWLLLDYRDVIVHIFNEETRQYYAIERIWSDAKRLEM